MSIADDRVKNIIVQQLGVAPAKVIFLIYHAPIQASIKPLCPCFADAFQVVNPASFTKDLRADQVGVTELFLALEEV